jgi:hypothetical protein
VNETAAQADRRIDLLLRTLWVSALCGTILLHSWHLGSYVFFGAIPIGVLTAVLALRGPRRARPHSEPPDTLTWTAHGFSTVLPSAPPPYRRNPLLVGLLLLAGYTAVHAVAIGVLYPSPSLYAQGLPTYVGQQVVHAALVLVGVLLALFAHGRSQRLARRKVRLEGTLLTVGDTRIPLGGELDCALDERRQRLRVRTTQAAVDIPGQPSELRWLTEQLHAASRPDPDDPDDVPEPMRRLRRAQESA